MGQNPPPEIEINWSLAGAHVYDIAMLKMQYRCPYFRILIIGRANAGKTTILEKVCGVEKGTKPRVIIHDKDGKLDESSNNVLSHSILFLLGGELEPCETHLMPSAEASQCCTQMCSLLTPIREVNMI